MFYIKHLEDMRKDGTQSAKDIRKTEYLNIRVDSTERSILERKAEQWGVALAQAARRLMFRPEPSATTEYDVKRAANQALSTLASDAPKAVSTLMACNENIEKLTRILGTDGSPLVTDDSIRRLALSILAESQKLRASINDASEKFESVEFKNKGRRKSEKGDRETALIRGKLAADPEVFTSRDDTYVKLVVAVNRQGSPNAKSVTYYNVYSRYDKMLTIFRTGQTVQVEGTMSLRKNDKGETVFSVWQDRVLLLDKI